MLTDGAGWHRAQALCIPDNITLIAIPPATPKCNPAEKAWQYLKDNFLSHRLFSAYEAANTPGTPCSQNQAVSPPSPPCSISYVRTYNGSSISDTSTYRQALKQTESRDISLMPSDFAFSLLI
jgi:hypothetical protein